MSIVDLGTLLRTISPVPHPGRYAFTVLPAGKRLEEHQMIASIREAEGLSVIIPEEVARAQGLRVDFLASWITLTVNSDLASIGLTAAFATALARAEIPCNVVAGVHHDHLFVPWEQGELALATLRSLQHAAG